MTFAHPRWAVCLAQVRFPGEQWLSAIANRYFKVAELLPLKLQTKLRLTCHRGDRHAAAMRHHDRPGNGQTEAGTL
mgnify:FL=1